MAGERRFERTLAGRAVSGAVSVRGLRREMYRKPDRTLGAWWVTSAYGGHA
jgi:hypothetical protein